MPESVVAAMSGGVDSSVAALRLVEAGDDVIGLFMRTGVKEESAARRCCSASDAADAARVARKLGIPFYALDFEEEFDRLVEEFCDAYLAGMTPSPCIVCNRDIKFGRLIEKARRLGAHAIATGHYVRRVRRGDGWLLARARDAGKDQSYFLFPLGREAVALARFPLGELHKEEVRELAREAGLPVAEKPDSAELCFLPDGDRGRLLAERRPGKDRAGEIRHVSGEILGRHDGVGRFTIGQRKGLGVATGTPLHVKSLDPATGTVIVAPREDVVGEGFVGGRVNWLLDPEPRPGEVLRLGVQIRHRHAPAPADVRVEEGGRMRVGFDEPQFAVTPGQGAAFYDGELLLGGCWIVETVPPGSSRCTSWRGPFGHRSARPPPPDTWP